MRGGDAAPGAHPHARRLRLPHPGAAGQREGLGGEVAVCQQAGRQLRLEVQVLPARSRCARRACCVCSLPCARFFRCARCACRTTPVHERRQAAGVVPLHAGSKLGSIHASQAAGQRRRACERGANIRRRHGRIGESSKDELAAAGHSTMGATTRAEKQVCCSNTASGCTDPFWVTNTQQTCPRPGRPGPRPPFPPPCSDPLRHHHHHHQHAPCCSASRAARRGSVKGNCREGASRARPSSPEAVRCASDHFCTAGQWAAAPLSSTGCGSS